MVVVTQFVADYLLIAILAVGGVISLTDVVRQQAWYKLSYVVMAGLTSLLVAKIVSVTYQPSLERPFVAKGVEPGAAFIDNPGFPSDHALLAVAIIGAVWFLTRRSMLVVLLALAALAMSLGRVVALVHTPLDIAGGVLAGLVGYLWYAGAKKHK